ncbi:hypothetical protein SPAN111604_06835 [Sphingomonas antarctica]|uniref:hypothetical protein n=1 Tax=Sphingomonas antarctica TaxID=2040274 RepID=UPI0039ED27E4
MSAALVMMLVAAALAVGAIVSAVSLKNAYARRIVATMLGSGAILLGAYAFALHGWDSGQ